MPSLRKRIGYLPSINAQEMITKIANKEKLSQSKVVGILVEEALIARGRLDLEDYNDLTRKVLYGKKNNNTKNLSIKYNELDALISDKGIIFNTKKSNHHSEENCLFKERKKYNDELFEQFKQFILFQKTIQDK